MDALKSIDTWFLLLAVSLLGGYFVWSMKKLVDDFKTTIQELKDFIKDLYEHKNGHESRITTLETKCRLHHGERHE